MGDRENVRKIERKRGEGGERDREREGEGEREREESRDLTKKVPSLPKARGENRSETKVTRHQRGSDESTSTAGSQTRSDSRRVSSRLH